MGSQPHAGNTSIQLVTSIERLSSRVAFTTKSPLTELGCTLTISNPTARLENRAAALTKLTPEYARVDAKTYN